MAKEKKSVDLRAMNISFVVQKSSYKAVRFYPTKMTVDVIVFEDGIKDCVKTIPFAHLPKEIKKIIKPN